MLVLVLVLVPAPGGPLLPSLLVTELFGVEIGVTVEKTVEVAGTFKLPSLPVTGLFGVKLVFDEGGL